MGENEMNVDWSGGITGPTAWVPKERLTEAEAEIARLTRDLAAANARADEAERLCVWSAQHGGEIELRGEVASIYHYEDPSFPSVADADVLKALRDAMGGEGGDQ